MARLAMTATTMVRLLSPPPCCSSVMATAVPSQCARTPGRWHDCRMARSSGDTPDTGGQGQPSVQFTGQAPANELALTLGELARSLQRKPPGDDLLEAIVVAAVQTIPGAEHAGLMVVEGRRSI